MQALAKVRILNSLKKSGKEGVAFSKLRLDSKARNNVEFRNSLIDLIESGDAVEIDGRYYEVESLNLIKAKIIKNFSKFCFCEDLKTEEQIFIPGKFSKGALKGDLVLILPLKKTGNLKEGEVKLIYKKENDYFTGVLLKQEGRYYIKADKFSNDLLEISKDSINSAKVGDKVIAKIKSRGLKHKDHLCEIIATYGNSQKAATCARAILEVSGAKIKFPKTVYNEALRLSQKEISNEARKNRLDLTNYDIFTIDSSESKDLDDAVSIKKENDIYKVGVHIADVSHYVKYRSALDIEAFERGTSIYYANKVVPMLPEPLSNGICSLNPNVERLALSVLMEIDKFGKMKSFVFKKTIIKSKVKGVYKEINDLLENKADEEITYKYKDVKKSIDLMYELYKILKENKIKRGSPQLETTESKITLDSEENVVDIKQAKVGLAEGMIEEFMLLANEAAATLAIKHELPFIYRIHEQPSPQKIASLKDIVTRLGLKSDYITPKVKPHLLSRLLESTRGTDLFPIMNINLLRSMAKAKYLKDPIGHYGLALKNYAHFTSPIRRYPDLAVHRIITDYVSHKDSVQTIAKRYKKFVIGAAKKATETEKRAMEIERSAEDCYKAEYMKNHIGQTFDGVVTSIINKGMFVGLKNTIEGYVKVETLKGYFEYDGYVKLINKKTGYSYKVGQSVKVKCVAADVNDGKVDFVIV